MGGSSVSDGRIGRAAGVSHAIDVRVRPGQGADVGDRHDRRGAESPVAGGHVDVELRRPAVAESLIQGNGAGHEASRVEPEYRRSGLSCEALAAGEQSARDTEPARGGMDGERAAAGPADAAIRTPGPRRPDRTPRIRGSVHPPRRRATARGERVVPDRAGQLGRARRCPVRSGLRTGGTRRSRRHGSPDNLPAPHRERTAHYVAGPIRRCRVLT